MLLKSFSELGDKLRDFKSDLLFSDLSTLSPEEKFNEARKQFDLISTKAKLGDAEAIAELPSIAKTFLEISKSFNASGWIFLQ